MSPWLLLPITAVSVWAVLKTLQIVFLCIEWWQAAKRESL